MWDLKRETLGFDPIKIVINANADLIHTYECVSVYVCVLAPRTAMWEHMGAVEAEWKEPDDLSAQDLDVSHFL